VSEQHRTEIRRELEELLLKAMIPVERRYEGSPQVVAANFAAIQSRLAEIESRLPRRA
jgi:hypothetical protein